MKNHLKRLAAPKSWKIKRKGQTFITRPYPSGHALSFSLPLNIVLRDILKVAKTTKEVRSVLHENEVLVDGKRRRNQHYAFGFFDVLSIPALKKSYRLVLDAWGKLVTIPVVAKEESLKLCKVVGKTSLKKGVVQLHFHDGKCFLMDKSDKNVYRVGDTVVFNFNEKKITQHLSLAEGVLVYLVGGSHVGSFGKVDKLNGSEFVFKSQDGDSFTTLTKYAFVVGKDTMAITLEEAKK